MKCNKDKCIMYNINFEDHCEKREDLTKACIDNEYKDYRETLEG